MYRNFPRRVPSLAVFLAAAIFWLATLGPPISAEKGHPIDGSLLGTVEPTILASNFVVGEDGSKQGVPTNESFHRTVEEMFLNLDEDSSPKHSPEFRREAPVPFTRDAWITNVLAEKLANFRPRSTSNAECDRQSELFEQNLKNLTLWAVQMRDASAKSASGFLYGQTAQLGNYDECLQVQSQAVSGRFCLAKIEFSPTYRLYPAFHYTYPLDGLNPPADANVWEYVKRSREPARERRDHLEWAVCVPSACGWRDVEESLREVLADVQKEHNIFLNVSLNDHLCSAEAEQKEMPASAKLFFRFLLFLTAISFAVTVYHHYLIDTDEYYQGGTGWRIMMGFSMVKSFRSLTATGSGMNLNGLDGLKFISMVMIIYGHRLMFALRTVVANPQSVEKEFLGPSVTIISTQLVDTFFTISGFLAFWLLYPVFKRSGASIIPFTLFYRWLRVMPLYMMMLAFVVLVFPYVEDGPVWKTLVFREADRCRENWWTNLLVINNYVNTEKMCTVHGWYLACDLQFFAVGVFIVYTFTRSHSVGLKLLLTALLISWVVPFMNTYLNDYDGILRTYIRVLSDPVANTHYRDFYTKSYNRAGPYLLGILSAYLVTVLREKKMKLTMGKRWLMVLGIAVIAEGTQCYGWKYFDIHTPASLLERSLYAAFHRSLWSLLACAIITIHLCWGFGSSIEYILKHDFYVPMSRLTYGAFLVHPFVQLYSTASERGPLYFTHTRMAWMGAGDIFSSYFIAFWLYCIIEAPAAVLSNLLKERIVGKKGPRSPETTAPSNLEKAEKLSNGYAPANGDYKPPSAGIVQILPKDAVCFGMEDQQKVEADGSSVAKESNFRNYTIKPEESAGGNVSERPRELSEKLESMLTSS